MFKVLQQHLSGFKNWMYLIIGSFIIFTAVRTIAVYDVIKTSLEIIKPGFNRSLEIFNEYVFSSLDFAPHGEVIFQVLFSFFMVLNILLFISFAQRQKNFLKGKGFWGSLVGIFLGFFGVGCVSCGVFLMAPLLSFLGLSAFSSFFQSNALLVSIIGLVLLFVSILYVARKLAEPLACKI